MSPPCAAAVFTALSNGTPSTTYKGEFPAVMEPVPRIFKDIPPPGAPDVCCTWTPATWPASASLKETTALSCNCFAPTDATEPVTSLFVCVPYPTTTTSFKEELPLSSSRLIVLWLLTDTSRSLKPTYEKTRVPPAGACNLKPPLESVAVPPLPPFTLTETPASACPDAFSVTTPLTG